MSYLKPFFTYYGGKWRAAPRYPDPLSDRIIEPFAGSAGYSLRHPHKQVLLCDKDPIIVSLWQYLIEVTPEEIRSLPLLEPGQTVDDIDVCEEARHLIGFWLNTGAASPRKSPSSWMRKWMQSDNRYAIFWGEAVRERIASQVDHISHWEVRHGDYTELPDVSATWYVDPPYQDKGKYYRFGSDNLDFEALGRWCLDRQGQVIVCENEGADWLPFEPFATIKNTLETGSREVWFYQNTLPSSVLDLFEEDHLK